MLFLEIFAVIQIEISFLMEIMVAKNVVKLLMVVIVVKLLEELQAVSVVIR